MQALRAKAEAIRSSELERTMARLPDSLSKKERRAVEDCTKSIVNKLLHGCMASLRCDGSDSAVGAPSAAVQVHQLSGWSVLKAGWPVPKGVISCAHLGY
jgi:glutamyl-tRNA reductase